MKTLQREPASRQAAARRTQAHLGQFGLEGTLGTHGATGVVGSVSRSPRQWPGSGKRYKDTHASGKSGVWGKVRAA